MWSASDRSMRVLQVKALIRGARRCLAAIHREIDALKNELKDLDGPSNLTSEDYYIGSCVACDEPVCSECSWECPHCGAPNPLEDEWNG